MPHNTLVAKHYSRQDGTFVYVFTELAYLATDSIMLLVLWPTKFMNNKIPYRYGQIKLNSFYNLCSVQSNLDFQMTPLANKSVNQENFKTHVCNGCCVTIIIAKEKLLGNSQQQGMIFALIQLCCRPRSKDSCSKHFFYFGKISCHGV